MIIWNEIDTVLLDMDGTLLDLNFDNYFWHDYLPLKWGELRGIDAESAKRQLMPRFINTAGTLSWYCLDFWSEQLGIDILVLKSDIGHLIKERPHALSFLQFLKSMNKQKSLVTNAHQSLIDMKFKRTQIGSHFDNVFCAHQFGHPKESLEFWKNLQESFPFNPSNTLLIDDNIDVLRTAGEYGIQHLFTIAQPDSCKPARECDEFIAIKSFAEFSNAESSNNTDPTLDG